MALSGSVKALRWVCVLLCWSLVSDGPLWERQDAEVGLCAAVLEPC